MPTNARRSLAKRTAARLAAPCSIALLAGTLAGSLAGCGANTDTGSEPETAQRPGRLIDGAALVERYNERAERITTLWARVSAVIEGEDAEGRDLRERAEGHLQIVPPDRVALTLGKVGQTNLYFGSDNLFYWWLDMIDGDEKLAIVGRHDKITPGKIDALGLPINPLDLVVTLGITPLPDEEGRIYARPGKEPGEVYLSVPTDRGVCRFALDEETAEPSRVAILDKGGEPAIDVSLSRYTLVSGLEPGEAPLRIPARIIVRMADFDGEIRFSLNAPERKEIRDVAFQVDRLIQAYSIEDIYDLDDPEGKGLGNGAPDGADESP